MTADTITAADIRINARWLIPIEPAGTVLEHYAVIIQGDRLAAVILWTFFSSRAVAEREQVEGAARLVA